MIVAKVHPNNIRRRFIIQLAVLCIDILSWDDSDDAAGSKDPSEYSENLNSVRLIVEMKLRPQLSLLVPPT
ncbi:unnamed protein product [Anisakis simplex]|uniref:Uncharacterized protein n=1 Tax=Anisakis simplex TaxID=6269 RepID=A0A0M3KHR9_ANISI|nr:unnamed protein product [Anisakis simplex]